MISSKKSLLRTVSPTERNRRYALLIACANHTVGDQSTRYLQGLGYSPPLNLSLYMRPWITCGRTHTAANAQPAYIRWSAIEVEGLTHHFLVSWRNWQETNPDLQLLRCWWFVPLVQQNSAKWRHPKMCEWSCWACFERPCVGASRDPFVHRHPINGSHSVWKYVFWEFFGILPCSKSIL